MLRGTVHCEGELQQAAPRCIPSARVQPKHLMKSESAQRTEHFHKNNALSVIPFFPLPFLPFYLSVALPSGHSCEDRSDGAAPPLTPVRFIVQQLDTLPVLISHLIG